MCELLFRGKSASYASLCGKFVSRATLCVAFFKCATFCGTFSIYTATIIITVLINILDSPSTSPLLPSTSSNQEVEVFPKELTYSDESNCESHTS